MLIDDILEWHAKFRMGVPSEMDFNPKVCDAVLRLLKSNIHAMMCAIQSESKERMLAALCNLCGCHCIIAVTLGVAREFAGYSKTRQTQFRAPSPLSAVAVISSLQQAATVLSIIHVKASALSLALSTKSLGDTVKNISDCFELSKGIGVLLMLDGVLDSALAAVHEGNMAKLWDNEAMPLGLTEPLPGQFSSESWPELSFTKSWIEGKYIAKNRAGKVIPPPGHPAIDLSRFVALIGS